MFSVSLIAVLIQRRSLTGLVVSNSAQCIQNDMDCVYNVYGRGEICRQLLSQKIMEIRDHLGDLDIDELCSVLLVYLPVDVSTLYF